MIEAALTLALSAHRGQTDKGGKPYILHPLRVMASMPDETHQTVAILHDVIEDSGIDVQELAKHFPANVVDAVDALSRREGETYQAFIERCGENVIARVVKRADLNDNVNTDRLPKPLSDKDFERLEKYSVADHYLWELQQK